MMNKSYKIKKTNWLQTLILCSFVQVYFLKKNYSVFIFNIVHLILLGKKNSKKQKVDKFTYIICNSKICKSLAVSITLFFLDVK